MQVPLFHPIALAEDLATLDLLSGGRLVVGAGAGYRPDEFTAFGLDYRRRYAMLEEALDLIARLWTDDEVTFHGRFWSVEGARPHLRPWQQPRPPLWVGAMRRAGVLRSARLGDAWPITPELRVPEIAHLLAAWRTSAGA